MNINGTFRFHNVGQGLFYSGILNKKDTKSHAIFSFVYDCGTDSSMAFLKSEIDSFKLLLPTNEKKLDLLVISHLHDDHVNGLEYLLKDIKVDTVVMPYIDDGLKSLPLVESSTNNDFLRTFYIDPVNWFSLMGVRRVMLLGAEGIEQKVTYLPSERPLDNDDSDFQVDPESVLSTDSIDGTSIIYLRNRASIRSRSYCWEFKFENLKLDPKLIDAYQDIVKDYIGKYKTLENILKDKNITKDLRTDINNKCGYIQNRTSVIFLHRTKADKVIAQLNICNCNTCRYLSPIKSSMGTWYSTVLTDDIELKKNESFQILPIDPDEHRYLVIQFPHHGAKNDCNINYFSELHTITMVLSYGITNKFGHPNGAVLSELRRFNLVNERQAFDYQITVF